MAPTLWAYLAGSIERERVYASEDGSDGIVVSDRRPARDGGVVVPRLLRGGDIRALIAQYSWPVEDAMRIAGCESGLNPNAISPDGQNVGLFQINLIHAGKVGGDVSRLFDPATNVAVAYAIWLDYGGHWTAWSCR